MNQQNDINELRKSIDEIDNSIVELLQKRLACAIEIGKIKENTSRAKRDPAREQQIFERLFQKNQKIFPEKTLETIYREIISACFLAQK